MASSLTASYNVCKVKLLKKLPVELINMIIDEYTDDRKMCDLCYKKIPITEINKCYRCDKTRCNKCCNMFPFVCKSTGFTWCNMFKPFAAAAAAARPT